MKPIIALFAALGCIGCSHGKPDAPIAPPAPPAAAEPPATVEMIRAADQRKPAQTECKARVTLYDGLIEVDATSYVQPVPQGDAWVQEAIPDLDRVVASAPRLDFTLDYPFEKPFTSSLSGEVTLRRVIDAVRGGMRHMYEGTTQRDIPNMENKDVTGPYGRAFHVIGDLVIERIDLCDGRAFEISIGS